MILRRSPSSRQKFTASLVLLVLFLTTACAVNPVTGKKELMLISEKQEIAMGRDYDRSLREEFGVSSDPYLTEIADRLCREMAPYSHRPQLEFHIAILDTPVENAFALPGGWIYVTRGLMELANSEAELAVVIGHEMGHVCARHSVRELSKQLLIEGGLVVAALLNRKIARVVPILFIATQILFLKYSRDDEYQADALGVDYARRAGYQPGEMVGFFRSIQHIEERTTGFRMPTFLSTHPMTAKRIDRVQALLAPGDERLAVRRDSYLRAMDGMVYGSDPSQGYVEGRAFYHPGLGFYFYFPEGWQVENTPRQVLIAPAGNSALLRLSTGPAADSLREACHAQLGLFHGVDVKDESPLWINGLPAYQALFTAAGLAEDAGEGLTRARLTCVQQGNQVLTFLAVAAEADFSRYDHAMQQTIRSLRPLTESAHLRRPPRRIHIVRTDRAGPLRMWLQGQGVAAADWPLHATLNAIGLDEQVPAATLLKLVR